MRLEVFCEDRLGLARELLDLLASRNIDLRGIEIDPAGRIYLNVALVERDTFPGLMAEIRRIQGVTDVRTLAFMPSEREHRALEALLAAMPEPVLSVDLKGKVELTNPAALALFNLPAEKMRRQPIGGFIGGFNFTRWLENERPAADSRRVVLAGQDFLMDITPVRLADDDGKPAAAGAVILLKSAVRMGRQLQETGPNDDSEFGYIIAASVKMRQVVEHARKLAMLDAPLLIVGETGTGKDLMAHACHLRSPRGKQPFLALNCAALPDDVAESELFGHAAGAYPNALESKKGFFEQAGGGSVLLDEIGEMSPRMQTKLLRFLNDGTFRRVGEDQEMHVDVRVICATQKNLLELVHKGQFREDLYYRLNVMPISLPPLRERQEDIVELAQFLIAKLAAKQGRELRISDGALRLLMSYSWPGNVRELENCLERASVMSEEGLIDRDIILFNHSESAAMSPPAALHGLSQSSPHSQSQGDGDMDDRQRLIAALEKSGWVQAKAARLLGMTPRQVAYRIQILNINMHRL